MPRSPDFRHRPAEQGPCVPRHTCPGASPSLPRPTSFPWLAPALAVWMVPRVPGAAEGGVENPQGVRASWGSGSQGWGCRRWGTTGFTHKGVSGHQGEPRVRQDPAVPSWRRPCSLHPVTGSFLPVTFPCKLLMVKFCGKTGTERHGRPKSM